MLRFPFRAVPRFAVLVFLALACSDDATKKKVLADGCTMNSDCGSGLVCTFQRCHAECETSRDCEEGARCVPDADGTTVCLLPVEGSCVYNSDCGESLVCAADWQCRTECKADRDCLYGQVCSSNKTCAEPEEVDDDGDLLDAKEPEGSGGSGGEAGSEEEGGSAGEAAGGTTASAGGMTSTGGVVQAAGGASAGGASSTGGVTQVQGGTTSVGGSLGTGGTRAAGGSPGAGGETVATGGITSTGGSPGAGGETVARGGTTSTGGSLGAGGETVATGGTTSTGGSPGTGGETLTTGGAVGTTGGAGGEATGGQGTGGSGTGVEGPCDIYAAANTPCVAAYSMVRRLSRTYSGPLYMVRSGSSATNEGSGGEVHDIGMTADGLADAAAQDAVCGGTTCTVSLLYDQSGNGNDLPVAKRGPSGTSVYFGMDDFESIADAGPLTVGGHDVYSLFMAARQGYRTPPGVEGNKMPLGTESQGIYMLADGTHWGSKCCWDFGNVTTTDPIGYGFSNALFFGTAYWGEGADAGPWFMAAFEAGAWAGGSTPTDPGWGALDTTAPPNDKNPSMGMKFAFGVLKTDPTNYALRMGDTTVGTLTTAYHGKLPTPMNNEGGIVLGVSGENANDSWGTFYEGAIVAGFPSDATDLAIMQNIQSVGYGQ